MTASTVSVRRRHVPLGNKGTDHIYWSERADGTRVYEVRMPGVKRVYETVGTRLDEAKARARVAWGAANPAPIMSTGTRLCDVVAHWQEHRIMRPRSSQTFDAIWHTHIEPTFGNVRVRDIDKFRIQTWIGNLKRRDGKPGELATGTRKLVLATLFIILKHGVEMGALTVVPMLDSKARPKSSPGRVRVLTQVEQERLLAKAVLRPWLQDVVLVAVNQALRLGEVCGLSWDDIDFAGGTINVRHSLGQNRQLGPTKGGKEARIEMQPQARVVLLRMWMAAGQPGDGFVFVNSLGLPRRLRDIQRGFSDAVTRAELEPGVVFHTLRHTCASRLANHPGVALVDVRDFLRHSSLVITQNYVHAIPSEAKRGLFAEALAS